MSGSISSTGPITTRPLVPSAVWWSLALIGAAATAVLTTRSLGYAACFVAVAVVLCVYLRSARAGLILMWVLWLVLPAVRRVLGLSEGFADADPLAAAPFAAIAIIGLAELSRAGLNRRGVAILFLALAGFAFGAPAGVLRDPAPAVFALFAYGSAVLAFVAGFREPREPTPTLLVVLVVAAVPLSLYGILQIAAPLLPWDEAWLDAVDLVSIGNKDDGTLRAFSTLNSAGTLAVVLSLAVIGFVCLRRFRPPHVAALLVTLAGLGLTLVRSAWIALAVALLALLVTSPRRIGARVALAGAVSVAAVLLLFSGTQFASTIGDRAATLGDLSSDTSAQARVATPSLLVPALIREPLGVGLGAAGEASRLGSGGGLRAPDNALLSVIYQSGAVGLILVLAALVLGFASAIRNVRRRHSVTDVTVLGCLVLLGVALLAGDVFYGVTGVMLWYLVGFAVRSDDHANQRTAAPERL